MHNKIRFRRRTKTRRIERLFVAANKFEVEGFPVRIRHFRLGSTTALETSLEASESGLERATRANRHDELRARGFV